MLPHVTELGQADLQPGGDYWKSDFKELLLWSRELEKCAHSCVFEVLVPRTEELQQGGKSCPGKLTTGLKARGCLVKGYPSVSSASFKAMPEVC